MVFVGVACFGASLAGLALFGWPHIRRGVDAALTWAVVEIDRAVDAAMPGYLLDHFED